jgi:hypothetical protein
MRLLDSISSSGLICRCCGNKVYSLSGANESVCNFCEAYVSSRDKDVVHGNRDIENNLGLMQSSAASGRWVDGAAAADSLAATNDPCFLYGASSFYRFFSDHTYYGVDYNLGGFMYSNAEKRSDEVQRNKYNAVALISKSKEFLFKSLKIINASPNPEDHLLFIKFMANVKLNRLDHAQKTLAEIGGRQNMDMVKFYANTVWMVNGGKKLSDKYIDEGVTYGLSNILYYLAISAAKHGDLDGAINMLDQLAPRSNMPAALYAGIRLRDIRNASSI